MSSQHPLLNPPRGHPKQADRLSRIGRPPLTENNCERFFYALHNANYNVMALVTGGVLGGHLAERYEYTPYGERQVYSHGWMLADVDGDHVDDVDLLLTVLTGGAGSQPPDSRFDANGDGVVTNADIQGFIDSADAFGSKTNDPLVSYPLAGSFRGDPTSTVAGIALNEVGHQGLFHDEESDGVNNRGRYYIPRLRRFPQRDPLGYTDGVNAYEYLQSRPLYYTDPLGESVADQQFARQRLMALFHKHRGYTYTSTTGLDRLIGRAIAAISTHSPEKITVGPKGNSYQPLTGQMVLLPNATSEEVLHEVIHLINHKVGAHRPAPVDEGV